jgi:hypothetical protein
MQPRGKQKATVRPDLRVAAGAYPPKYHIISEASQTPHPPDVPPHPHPDLNPGNKPNTNLPILKCFLFPVGTCFFLFCRLQSANERPIGLSGSVLLRDDPAPPAGKSIKSR